MDRLLTVPLPSRVAVELTGMSAMVWAYVLLTERWLLIALLSPLAVVSLVRMYRDRRSQQQIAEAVLRHRDPGPRWRGRVDDAARTTVGTPTWRLWLQPSALGAAGAGCLVLAVLGADPWLVAPSAALTGLAVVSVVLLRRATTAAALWLADPPRPEVVQPGPRVSPGTPQPAEQASDQRPRLS